MEKNEMKNNEVAINIPQTNVSRGSMSIHVGELTVTGVSLKDLHVEATAVITDENIRVQCDYTFKIVQQLLGKFGDSLVGLLQTEVEVAKSRKAMYEAQTKEIEARAAKSKKDKKEE